MAFDDISNKELQLGLGLVLGLHDQPENRQRKKEEAVSKCNTKGYPSLTLGPPYDEANNDQPATKTESIEYFNPQASSSPSAVVSSFSNSSSIKRERDQFLSEEFEPEVEKVPSRVVGDVVEDGSTRKKLRLTKEQSAVLEDSFKEHSTLNPKQKQELAGKLNLRPRQVEVWFQNRRARTKLKQTESECELLKKCCETLSEENRRLQKELQELISIMKTTPAGAGAGAAAAPFYMQLPLPAAATLTICPSCERICNGSSPTTSLLIASNSKPNHHLHKDYYPFTHSSSAAC